MICHNCGQSNPPKAQFCTHCNEALQKLDAEAGGVEPADDAELRGPASAASEAETQLSPRRAAPASDAAAGAGGSAALAPLRAGVRLGPRYRIVRQLGRGGMGAVYLAHDLELGRDVALKLIVPELAADPGSLERFKREIHLASLVTHPNVLRVYDLGESDGVRFLTMQYVDGHSLDELLRSERPLPVDRTLALFRQICEGLAAAHDTGVLHRDLKPQNVMVDAAGHVCLTDFGLATTQSLAALTRAGALLGTPHYMSPEQVKAEPVDARSDIFSLGVILFEMLTGRRPFTGDSAFEVMMKRVREPAPRALDLDRSIPEYLQKLLDRCLATDRSLRYGSVRDVIADLEAARVRTSLVYEARRRRLWRPVAAALAVALAVGAGWVSYRAWVGRIASAPSELPPLVGIAPFVNRTDNRDLDWLGEGAAQLVADALTRSRHVRVVSPQRIADLHRSLTNEANVLAATAAAGISHVVTGDILPSGADFVVSCRLTDTKTGADLASHRSAPMSAAAILGVANAVTLSVRRGLGLPLTEGVDTFAADFAARNTEAYEAYVQGLRAMADYRYPEALRRFRIALARAPDFTMARLRLANALAAVGQEEDARAEIRTAVAEAANLPDREASYVRATEAYVTRRWGEAETLYRGLTERYAYDLEPRQFLGHLYLSRGEWARAIEQAEVMARIDAGAPSTYAVWGSAFLGLKDYSQAIAQFRKYADLDAGSANAHHLMGDAYRAQGVLDLAAAEYAKAMDIDPEFHFSRVTLAQVEALRGRYDAADDLLRPLAEAPKDLPGFAIDAAFNLASVLRAQGRFRDATAVLQSVDARVRGERIRQALSLAVRAMNAVELQELSRAESLAREAIAKSPSTPTRYLFALGLVQLRQGRPADSRATAARILENALPSSDPDRTEEKAAAYLRGLTWLEEGKLEAALRELSHAVALSGYEYARYRLALTRAHLAAGDLTEAFANATQAAAPLDPADPRLDLELDRVRAILAQARVSAALGRRQEASSSAATVVGTWAHADPELADLVEARHLAGLAK